MGIPEKDRFEKNGLAAPVVSASEVPKRFFHDNNEYHVLGVSDDSDLLLEGDEGQYIVVSNKGDFYDVTFSLNEDGFVYVTGIRTRPGPEKPRKKKG